MDGLGDRRIKFERTPYLRPGAIGEASPPLVCVEEGSLTIVATVPCTTFRCRQQRNCASQHEAGRRRASKGRRSQSRRDPSSDSRTRQVGKALASDDVDSAMRRGRPSCHPAPTRRCIGDREQVIDSGPRQGPPSELRHQMQIAVGAGRHPGSARLVRKQKLETFESKHSQRCFPTGLVSRNVPSFPLRQCGRPR